LSGRNTSASEDFSCKSNSEAKAVGLAEISCATPEPSATAPAPSFKFCLAALADDWNSTLPLKTCSSVRPSFAFSPNDVPWSVTFICGVLTRNPFAWGGTSAISRPLWQVASFGETS
jgi:hypothetical protein